MKQILSWIDRAGGRLYNRVLALFCAVVAVVLAATGLLILWHSGGAPFAWLWLGGALLFGLIARHSWRSRAPLSEALDQGL